MSAHYNDPAFKPVQDIPMYVSSAMTSSERRVSPAWTIRQFKERMESVTGIPAGSQALVLRSRQAGTGTGTDNGNDDDRGDRSSTPIAAPDESVAQLYQFCLFKYGEIYITDTRSTLDASSAAAAAAVAAASASASAGPPSHHLSLAEERYAAREDSVRAWKRREQLGEFDPAVAAAKAAAAAAAPRIAAEMARTVDQRRIVAGGRCVVRPAGAGAATAGAAVGAAASERRGTVRFVGQVPELPTPGTVWVGVELDEPTGKNDGSVGVEVPEGEGEGEDEDEDDDEDDEGQTSADGLAAAAAAKLRSAAPGLVLKKVKTQRAKRTRKVQVFECRPRHGVFVRPDRVEMGDFGELLDDELNTDDELAEL